MSHYVGLDVSLEQTAIGVVDDDGKPLWQGKCASTPEMLVAAIRTRAPQAARIGLESGPLSLWHRHALRRAGLSVVCLDARHAKAALSLQLNKSDRNDARGLAQIVRTGPRPSADGRPFGHGSAALPPMVPGGGRQELRQPIDPVAAHHACPAGPHARRSRQPDPGRARAVRPDCRQGRRPGLCRAN